ncbi:hypothetical protein [Nonomuraea sp. NPDC049695]|uniref:WD40 repeat domain-containing protein n=1 Tax=Nonomuraea sp. NPDC049695 TaxID=3154734 RepID=UPI0034476EA5
MRMRIAVAAGLLLPFAIVPAAQARKSDPIRYAVPLKDGKLRVVLRSGAARTLKALAEGTAPVAVSEDGTRAAYFRPKDRALVTYPAGRRMGSIRQPRNEAGVDETRLMLSPDGRRLAYFGNDGLYRARVFDTATGKKIGTLPPPTDLWAAGFSGDGGEVLLVSSYAPTTDAVVTDLRGRVLRRDTPPQIVGHNLPRDDSEGKVAALAADGRRIVVYVPGEAPGLVVYDLTTRQTGQKLPLKQRPAAATWTGNHEVTLRVDDGKRTQRLKVDVESGAIEVVDAYRTPTNRAYHAGG